jgi:hypothetical protein
MVQCHYRVMLVIALLSYAGNGADESCWRWLYRGIIGRNTILLSSHASDGATTQGCTACGKVAQPSSLEHRGVVIA